MYSQVDVAIPDSPKRLLEGLVIVGRRGLMKLRAKAIVRLGCGKEAQTMYSRVDVAISISSERLLEGLVIEGHRGLICRQSQKISSNSSVGLSEVAGHSFHSGSQY